MARILSGQAKEMEIARLLDILKLDLDEKNLLPPRKQHSAALSWQEELADQLAERNALLAELKTHIQVVEDSGPLFTPEVRNFDGNSMVTSREASKCLANVLLLEGKTRQMFVDLGYPAKAAQRLKTGRKEPPTATDVQALSDTLKLLFNLSQYYPQHLPDLAKSAPNILKMLCRTNLATPVLQPPVNYLVNALLNLSVVYDHKPHLDSDPNPYFPKPNQFCNIDRFISILDNAIRTYTDEQLEQLATPLVTLLRKVFEFAPTQVRPHMQTALLPCNSERSRPLGQSNTLASRLLRLSNSPVAPSLRESVSSLLFELSDKDATSFVRNVGYGFAAGFLMTHDLPVPVNATEAWSTAHSAGDPGEKVTNVDGKEINPVTGQIREMEPEASGEEMTEEEKEREAERLFVLFERLKATGVVNVKNPVEQALQQDRFEEVDEDA
ncbi:MAG: hypothetical protein Q9211_001996 [Gyalolechia sp. 1 TL-2023]